MKTASISNILKCMNPQCTRVIVTRGARRWAGPEVPSEQIHKLTSLSYTFALPPVADTYNPNTSF
jgi:hypothetical protein